MPTPSESPLYKLLTPQQQTFVNEYVTHGDPIKAAQAAYPEMKDARVYANRLLKNATVVQVIAFAQAETSVTSRGELLNIIWGIARDSHSSAGIRLEACGLIADLEGMKLKQSQQKAAEVNESELLKELEND